jgi:hypothetical protein
MKLPYLLLWVSLGGLLICSIEGKYLLTNREGDWESMKFHETFLVTENNYSISGQSEELGVIHINSKPDYVLSILSTGRASFFLVNLLSNEILSCSCFREEFQKDDLLQLVAVLPKVPGASVSTSGIRECASRTNGYNPRLIIECLHNKYQDVFVITSLLEHHQEVQKGQSDSILAASRSLPNERGSREAPKSGRKTRRLHRGKPGGQHIVDTLKIREKDRSLTHGGGRAVLPATEKGKTANARGVAPIIVREQSAGKTPRFEQEFKVVLLGRKSTDQEPKLPKEEEEEEQRKICSNPETSSSLLAKYEQSVHEPFTSGYLVGEFYYANLDGQYVTNALKPGQRGWDLTCDGSRAVLLAKGRKIATLVSGNAFTLVRGRTGYVMNSKEKSKDVIVEGEFEDRQLLFIILIFDREGPTPDYNTITSCLSSKFGQFVDEIAPHGHETATLLETVRCLRRVSGAKSVVVGYFDYKS